MNKGSHLFWKTMKLQAFILILLSEVTLISSEYGPPMLSLLRPSSLSLTEANRHEVERVLYLKDFPNYATVLPLADGRSWVKSEEIIDILGEDSHSDGFTPFTVTPPEGHGIMATIQELQIPSYNTFNRSLLIIDDNGRILECFSQLLFQIEGKSEVKVCGRTNDHLQFRSSIIDGVGPRSFVVPVGKSISVGFVYRDAEIDQNPTLAKQVPFYDMGYLFRASIAFTAYKACPHGPPFFNENKEKLWPCDIPPNSNEPVAACVREELFCDGVINCGMHDSKEFAIDERFCKEKTSLSTSPNNSSIMSHRGRQIVVNKVRLEEAIKNRMLTNNRPFGYNDMLIQMGANTGGKGGAHYASQPVDKGDALTHPAFVALIILITIICVLIIGLIFRYCCNPCVGKSDPFGNSSNPEAVARFHENLRSRDHDVSGQIGRPYGISFDSLFKPVEDMPPPYDELFPHDVQSRGSNDYKSYRVSFSSSSPTRSSTSNVDSLPNSEYSSPLPVYSIPLVSQETLRSNNSIVSNSNGTSESNFSSAAVIHVEVLPGSSRRDSISPGRINNHVIAGNSDEDSVNQQGSTSATPPQSHHAYRIDDT